ncbi:MAG: hypothetical protein E6G85_13150 [Alphaproteobacteria bacterium]|nr:MAG: hypothetical protein E6G85_13150 [Alphaproteobacteria bacterium]
MKDTGPVVRFAARAQQLAALNDVIEATTSEFDAVDGSSTGTKLPSRDVRCPVANGGKPDMTRAAQFG